jgi:hypothetical protein
MAFKPFMVFKGDIEGWKEATGWLYGQGNCQLPFHSRCPQALYTSPRSSWANPRPTQAPHNPHYPAINVARWNISVATAKIHVPRMAHAHASNRRVTRNGTALLCPREEVIPSPESPQTSNS